VKILVLCERVDAEGGTETYLRTLLPALRARGHTLRVAARFAAQPDAYGVPVETIAWSDEHDPPSADAASAVERLASSFGPDVAAVHNVLDAGVLEAVRANAPRVAYHLHDHRPFCPNGDRLYPRGGGICAVQMGTAGCGWHALVSGCAYGPRQRTFGLIRLRERVARAVAAGDATIAFSRYVAALAQRNGVAAEKIRVVTPALEDWAFADSVAARPPENSILFAGRVVPSKGAGSMVRALASLAPDARPLLRVAGDGPDLDATVDEAHRLGVPLEALGRLDAVAMRDAYDRATLVAIPSLWGEPFGLVGIEAFARGRPVVAYDAGAIAEWLAPSGAGQAVPLRDERALGTAVAKLLDGDAWSRASANAFAAASNYRLGAHVERIEAIYGGRLTRA
jgi:glycosyltransferase involved in cell wall biosynthesis